MVSFLRLNENAFVNRVLIFNFKVLCCFNFFSWLINSNICVFSNNSFVLLHNAASEDAMYGFAPVNWVNVAPANTLCKQTNT